MTPRSLQIASNSRTQLSSSFSFNCFQTPSNAVGQACAGVGKHAEKLAYECVWIVFCRAELKILFSRVARGPGVDATGAAGGGDGDAEARAGIMSPLLYGDSIKEALY